MSLRLGTDTHQRQPRHWIEKGTAAIEREPLRARQTRHLSASRAIDIIETSMVMSSKDRSHEVRVRTISSTQAAAMAE
jgi:hypothetical protein